MRFIYPFRYQSQRRFGLTAAGFLVVVPKSMFGRQPSTVSGSGIYISNSRLYCNPLGRPPTIILVKAAVNNTEALLGNIRALTRRESGLSGERSDSAWLLDEFSKRIHPINTNIIVMGFILNHSTYESKLSSNSGSSLEIRASHTVHQTYVYVCVIECHRCANCSTW